MEVDQLETFLAIAQLGGFSRAGARVHRSQPAVSRRLRLLENELGAPLFERIRGVVRLTDVGRALLPHAEAVLAAHHGAREAVREQLQGGPAEVRLAVVGTLLDRRLCQRLKRFRAAHAGLRLTLRTGASAEVCGLVQQGEVTLGVCYFKPSQPGLVCVEIGREEMIVVAAADHPRLSARPRSVEALADETWLGFPSTKAYKEAFGRVLRSRLAAAQLEGVAIMEVDSLMAQKRLVEAGFGLALLPRSAVREELEAGRLIALRAPQVATTLPICLLQRKHGFLSAAARALSEELSRYSE